MADNMDQKASDWEVACLMSLAFADEIGGGLYSFMFRSQSAGVFEPFFLCAAGIGFGGNQSGVSAEQLSNPDKLDFSPVTVLRPFSAQDIHLSMGLITSASAGVPSKVVPGPLKEPIKRLPANYGKTSISASDRDGRFFYQSGRGFSLGSGLGVLAFAGRWYSYRLNGNSINPLQAEIDGVENTMNEMVRQMVNGIYQIYHVPY